MNAAGADGSDRKKKRGRKVSSNPDTAIIAAAIDAHMKKHNIDPMSKDGKKQRRQLRNRMSAQLHRERKKAYIDELEAKVRDRDAIIDRMSHDMEALKKENATLKKKLGLPMIDLTMPPSSHSHLDGSTSDEDSDSISTTDDSSSKMSSKSSGSYRLLSVILLFCWAFYGIRPDASLESTINTMTAAMDGSSGSSPSVTLHLPRLPAPQGSLHNIWANLQSQLQQNPEAVLKAIQGRREHEDGEDNRMAKEEEEVSLHHHVEEDDHDPNHSHLSILPPVIPLPSTASGFPLPNHAHPSAASRSLVSRNHAMWKYQSHVLQLFPQLHIDDHEEAVSASHRVYPETTTRRFLRARRDVNASYKSTSSSTVDSSLIFVPPSDINLSADLISSRVLMTEGKTLLDPSLACKSAQLVQHDPSSASATVINHLVPSPHANQNARTIFSMRMDSATNIPTSTAVAITADKIHHVTPDQSNLLVMLIPATSVRWGKSWSESADNSMDWMLRSLNYSSNASSSSSPSQSGQSHDGSYFQADSSGSDSSLEDLWIEIGCSIFRAQVVRNVTINK
jgi:hypothetical protein